MVTKEEAILILENIIEKEGLQVEEYLNEDDSFHYLHVHLKNKCKYCGFGKIYKINKENKDVEELNLKGFDVLNFINKSKDPENLKIIFLDIDGVLNSDEYFNNRVKEGLNHPLTEFDPLAVARLNKILEETDAKIVVSSDWRWTNNLDTIFEEVGIKGKIYDRTGYRFGIRDEEVEDWLEKHNVVDYVIIDDQHNFNKERKQHFFRTKYNDGLTDDIMNKIIKYFNKN